MEFASILGSACSCGARVWDVEYADGTRRPLHDGLLPNSLTPRQLAQIRAARNRNDHLQTLVGAGRG